MFLLAKVNGSSYITTRGQTIVLCQLFHPGRDFSFAFLKTGVNYKEPGRYLHGIVLLGFLTLLFDRDRHFGRDRAILR